MKFNIALLPALIGLATAAPTPEDQGGPPTWRRDAKAQVGRLTWRRDLEPQRADLPRGSGKRDLNAEADRPVLFRRSPESQNGPPTWKRQYNTGTIRPSFTHVWTATPGLGFFEASSTGYVRFETTETDQTFQPDASLRGQSAIVGFDFNAPRDEIKDGTAFQVFFAQEDLVLEKDKNKSNTNSTRGSHVARFVFENGVPQLPEGESGKFRVPDKTQFTLQVVGSDGAEFEFNAVGGEGLSVTSI
ncbi:hypothetical protein P171DRAFT_480793 [Karstenula rhodostoma CBS 690.94]|uniref:Concanavalin A-like lectin/glucanase n=1 Tax=Karstenula rhodostoma CBS 690.94 TaxID=1392251 RepID=A0A9P4PVV1_9PLEO|nr:hypothetical protein P171DRAFT_480793 [Karstenula rhodostoma CBS 690.94]